MMRSGYVPAAVSGREVVEECTGVGHDVGRRRQRNELVHENFALLWIGEHRVRIHRLIRAGPVIQIRQQHEVAMRCEPFADLEHRGADA